jgi:hypothetical protein
LPDQHKFCHSCGAPQDGAPAAQAKLDGSGAIAQGEGATSAGEHSIAVGGSVGGSVIMGNVYHGPPTTDPDEALRIYRQVLLSACCNLPLRGVDLEASDPTVAQQHFSLADVYVDLDTTTQVEREEADEEDPLLAGFGVWSYNRPAVRRNRMAGAPGNTWQHNRSEYLRGER